MLWLGGCASNLENTEDYYIQAANGGPIRDFDKKLAKAQAYPLGSKDNPIRVYKPDGEYTYLKRLRCRDEMPPVFRRMRNIGMGVFDHIVDEYLVECPQSEPLKTYIYMDMYFRDYQENRAPEGFKIVPEPRQRLSSHGS